MKILISFLAINLGSNKGIVVDLYTILSTAYKVALIVLVAINIYVLTLVHYGYRKMYRSSQITLLALADSVREMLEDDCANVPEEIEEDDKPKKKKFEPVDEQFFDFDADHLKNDGLLWDPLAFDPNEERKFKPTTNQDV